MERHEQATRAADPRIGRNIKEWIEEQHRLYPELQAEYERLGPRFMVIGEISRARKRLGLTQRQLAERMGVSQPVVARLLSGDQSPRIDTVAAAAAALECELVIELRPRVVPEARAPSELAGVAEEAPTYRPRTPRAPRAPRGGGKRR